MTATTAPSRTHHHPWDPSWATAPPPSCSTLRNLNGALSWGETCVFAAEDGDPLPASINTACMPWITSNAYPSPSAFYFPATACPESWTAVATQVAGEGGAGRREQDWIDGETGLQCCPAGFEADGGTACKLGGKAKWPVVVCGEADAEENEVSVYDAAAWREGQGGKPGVAALMLRYQSGNATSTGPTGASGTGSEGSSTKGGGGMSTGAVAAIATVVPLVVIVAAVLVFLLWRRRRKSNSVVLLDTGSSEKEGRISGSSDAVQHVVRKGAAVPFVGGTSDSRYTHETPEWNVEMDAMQTERQHLVASQGAQSGGDGGGRGEAAELAGIVRVPRKCIAPVEIDGTPVMQEVGDAYIPYRPGTER
jgi:hypothetical protein